MLYLAFCVAMGCRHQFFTPRNINNKRSLDALENGRWEEGRGCTKFSTLKRKKTWKREGVSKKVKKVY